MQYLRELLAANDTTGHLAEIGTLQGEGSTRILMDYASKKGCHFYTIDIFTDDTVFEKVSTELTSAGCHVIKGASVAVGQKWPADRKLDFLFIDGDHSFPHITPAGNQTGVMLDIITWHSHLKPGGILAFHDYTGTSSHYGEISLMGVEFAVDCLCRHPAYEFIGRKESIVAFRKIGEHIVTPIIHLKKPVSPYEDAWKELNRRKRLPSLIIYGTGGGAKYMLDSILANQLNPPEIVFTDSSAQKTTIIFGNYQVIPRDKALQKKGIFLCGSLQEEEISRIFEQSGKIHLEDYYNHFEFIGWCHVGRLTGDYSLTWPFL